MWATSPHKCSHQLRALWMRPRQAMPPRHGPWKILRIYAIRELSRREHPVLNFRIKRTTPRSIGRVSQPQHFLSIKGLARRTVGALGQAIAEIVRSPQRGWAVREIQRESCCTKTVVIVNSGQDTLRPAWYKVFGRALTKSIDKARLIMLYRSRDRLCRAGAPT